MSFNFSPKIITEGLVLYLDAANPKSYVSGSTTWYDISKNSNNGTLNGNTSYIVENGGKLKFTTAGDYVTAPPPFLVGDCSFSIGVWIYLVSLPSSNPRIINVSTDSNNFYSIGTYGGGNPGTYDTFWFEVKKGGVLCTTGWNTSTKYLANTWYYLVGTFDNNTNTSKLYWNAVIKDGDGINGSISSTNTLFIGGWPGSSINGYIPTVQFYSKVLTPQEILQNYNAHKSRYGL